MGAKAENEIRTKLDHTWQRFILENHLKSAVVQIQGDLGNDFTWSASTSSEKNQPFFLGELAELHFAALLLKLMARGKLSLEDPVCTFLPKNLIETIDPWPKQRHFEKIRVHQLFDHTSGLPDPFTDENKNSIYGLISKNGDKFVSIQDRLTNTKNLQPTQTPSKPKKSIHSFVNSLLQILVIEKASGKTAGSLLEELQYRPLGFTQTYLYSNHQDRTPGNLFAGEKELGIYQLMTCFGYAGSMVSSSQDTMALLRAFLHGHLFPPEFLPLSQRWVKDSSLVERGLGLERYTQKGFLNLISQGSPLIGKVSRMGAFALFDTEKKLFFTGSTNQVLRPDLPKYLVRTLSKLIP